MAKVAAGVAAAGAGEAFAAELAAKGTVATDTKPSKETIRFDWTILTIEPHSVSCHASNKAGRFCSERWKGLLEANAEWG
jgi:hypothetical protein